MFPLQQMKALLKVLPEFFASVSISFGYNKNPVIYTHAVS